MADDLRLTVGHVASMARKLLASANGRPVRAFCGFITIGHHQWQAVALDERARLVRSMPNTELEVPANTDVERLTGVLEDAMQRLLADAKKAPASPRPERRHGWRSLAYGKEGA